MDRRLSIKDFVSKYNKCATENLKDSYVKKALVIKDYLPLKQKYTLAENIVNVTVEERICIPDENLEDKYVGTGKIKVDTVFLDILFKKVVLENYTNLYSEKDNFFDEYDMLITSGLYDKLFGNYDEPLLPTYDILNFKKMLDTMKNDKITNLTCMSNIVKDEFSKLSNIFDEVSKPVMEGIQRELEKL